VSLYELSRPLGGLRQPVLIVVLDGWIDAGLGAATAATALRSLVSEPVATFDVDDLLDHRARRPSIRIADGLNSGLSWPDLQLLAGQDLDGNDVLLLAGAEPDHRWRAFADAVFELAGGFGVRLAVGLGAFPAPVPHTRPCRLAATATSAELAHQVGFVAGTLEVPAGAQGVLERRFGDSGVPAVGLWARVPHYAAAMPYPEASAVLLDGLETVAGLRFDSGELHKAAKDATERIDALVANNAEHLELVRRLEAAVDAETAQGSGEGDLPSGDEIAAEVERFLRGER
jgi:hypothetical protein